MKKSLLIFNIFLFGWVNLNAESPYIKGQIILHLNTPISIDFSEDGRPYTSSDQINTIAVRHNFKDLRKIPLSQCHDQQYFYHVDFDSTQDIKTIINELRSLPEVVSAEPNYLFELHAMPDPYFPLQWALSKIQISSAWNIEKGDDAIKVAVLDGGVDYYNSNPHPDLQANLLSYGGKCGINLINPGTQPVDLRGHGTHVLRIIGAVISNGIGISGVADISLLNIKVSDYGTILMETAALGIDTAVSLGAKVINMSFGYRYNPETPGVFDNFDLLHSAIQNAYNEDVVLIASLGNLGQDLSGLADSLQMYPAFFPEVISVCATDPNDVKGGYSNYAEWVDIAAPGGYGSTLNSDDIYSTTPRYYVDYERIYPNDWSREYGYLWGTSMATPHVSGLAGLILSYEPNIPPYVVKGIIKQTTDDISSQNAGQTWSGKIGAGRINAYSALNLLQQPPSTPTGFTSSSSGNHPRIYWNNNPEADVKEYKVKRVLWHWIGLPLKCETLTSYFATSDTFYQDNSFSIGSDNDKVYYSICAIDYCDNSSGCTSSIMYQGTSPLWKISNVENDTIIYCEPNLDGVIQSYEYDPNTFFTYIKGLYLITGDDDNNQTASISFRSYLSFDISSLKQYDIVNVILQVYQEQSFGDGVLGAYPVLKLNGDTTYCTVSHIVYGDSLQWIHWFAGDEGDSLTLESNIGYISTTPEVGFRSLDVTEQVKEDILAQRKHSQYRLTFPIRADQDYRYDRLSFYSSDSDSQQYWPRLEVTYRTTDIETKPFDKIPSKFHLSQNYPNPFNAMTTITYDLPETSPIIVTVYDLSGRTVKTLVNTIQPAGSYSLRWNAGNLPSGVYFYQIQAGAFRQVRKCLLVK